ncbi:hypothetical protein AYI68_g5082 [Smittium mucronatum]|uniref:Uncharacterized protein n=1 Tax=Smittium mucronatum TaxID=133383 RepID=A0A1R0GV89_9FUNG|nr:hypothetical protein AYI68_g5082 [Smittium mucronatum]
MLPNNKKKSLKKIKGKDKAHPYSRKAKQMSRAIERSEKMTLRKSSHLANMLPRANRFVWFRDYISALPLPNSTTASTSIEIDGADNKSESTPLEIGLTRAKSFGKDEIFKLATLYLARNDETVEELKSKVRPNRQMLPKDVLFIDSVKREKIDAATNGLDMPVLSESSNVATLLDWDGDVNSISLIKSTNIITRPQDTAETKRPLRIAKNNENEIMFLNWYCESETRMKLIDISKQRFLMSATEFDLNRISPRIGKLSNVDTISVNRRYDIVYNEMDTKKYSRLLTPSHLNISVEWAGPGADWQLAELRNRNSSGKYTMFMIGTKYTNTRSTPTTPENVHSWVRRTPPNSQTIHHRSSQRTGLTRYLPSRKNPGFRGEGTLSTGKIQAPKSLSAASSCTSPG